MSRPSISLTVALQHKTAPHVTSVVSYRTLFGTSSRAFQPRSARRCLCKKLQVNGGAGTPSNLPGISNRAPKASELSGNRRDARFKELSESGSCSCFPTLEFWNNSPAVLEPLRSARVLEMLQELSKISQMRVIRSLAAPPRTNSRKSCESAGHSRLIRTPHTQMSRTLRCQANFQRLKFSRLANNQPSTSRKLATKIPAGINSGVLLSLRPLFEVCSRIVRYRRRRPTRVFDRSSPLPTGGYLEQSDGTAWMAFFASVMLQIAVELAVEDEPHYEATALKYFEHFLWIASAMDNLSYTGVKLWDHNDGIYYDVLRFPDGNGVRLKVRSLVGLLPLAATTVLPGDLRERLPRFFEEAQWFLEQHPYTAATITVPLEVGAGGSRILSLVNLDKLRRILGYAQRERVPEPPRDSLHVALSRRASLCFQRWRAGVPGRLRSGRFGQRDVRG